MPYGPLSCIAVMSPVPGISIAFQLFVSSLLLTHMADLTLSCLRALYEGYICRKLIGVLIALKVVVWGSCNSIIS
jgi:hypothetical protein